MSHLFQHAFARVPRLETARLILRPLRMSDADDMFAYARDPEVSRHVLWSAHTSILQTRAFLRASIRQYRQGYGSLAIQRKADGKMIGTIGFVWVNREYRSAEVGYSLGRAWWNQGLMTEALRALVNYGFDRMGLNRIEAQHETDNPASGRVMAHVGMRREGTLRQRLVNKGKLVDVALYAILRDDPRL